MSDPSKPMRLGIAGLGTVGASTLQYLINEHARISARAGRALTVTGIVARNRTKDRGVDLSGMTWFDDPVAMATDASVDVYVELMGGSDGVAKASVEAALKAGKPVITANKALVAHHGAELAHLAESTEGASLHFEAAVAGGIPAVKALREGMAGNGITRVSGILNGTCNYILTEMETTGAAFDGVLAEAQRLGYAEADPTADVGGFDAAHKLAIMAAIAFGRQIDFGGVQIEGIERVSAEDIVAAEEMGYRIRLIGMAERTPAGVAQRLRPCMTPIDSPLGKITGVTNAVLFEGDAIGSTILTGPGAGGGPTASAVLADIIDVARNNRPPTFGINAQNLTPSDKNTTIPDEGPFYLRVSLQDKPGALAEIASALGSSGISIHRMRQHDHDGDVAPVAIVTHDCTQANLDSAKQTIASLDVSIAPPVSMRIIES